jgi:hypothetical protein
MSDDAVMETTVKRVDEPPRRRVHEVEVALASAEEAFVRAAHPEAHFYAATAPRGAERTWCIRKSRDIADHHLAKGAASPEEAWVMAAEQIRQGKDA